MRILHRLSQVMCWLPIGRRRLVGCMAMWRESVSQAGQYMVQSKYEGVRNYEAVLSLIRRIPHADSLLDVGCGDGNKTMRYANELAVCKDRVYGIEQHPPLY